MRKGFWTTILTGLALMLGASAWAAPVHVVATTFPMYLFTRQVTDGVPEVSVDLLLAANLGCPHDYIMTPQDMRKLATADILVMNGLQLEAFLGEAPRSANPRVTILDTSRGMTGLLPNREGPGSNPHLFASPHRAAQLVRVLASQLAAKLPASAARLNTNAQTVAARYEALAARFSKAAAHLKTRNLITQHDAFDYLAHDAGLTIVEVIDAHPGQAPDAATLMRLTRVARERQAGAIFSEPSYAAATAQTLSRETGLPVAALDPVSSGPAGAPLDYYERVMEKNIRTLEQTLGIR